VTRVDSHFRVALVSRSALFFAPSCKIRHLGGASRHLSGANYSFLAFRVTDLVGKRTIRVFVDTEKIKISHLKSMYHEA
jgi:dihydrodipicolinate reductase